MPISYPAGGFLDLAIKAVTGGKSTPDPNFFGDAPVVPPGAVVSNVDPIVSTGLPAQFVATHPGGSMFENLMPLETGPEFNFGGLGGAIAQAGAQFLTGLTQGAIGPIFDPVAEVSARQIETGVSRIQGKCTPARRRFKVGTDPEGKPFVYSVCPPRRMNPLNAKALGRAARRLGSFQRIATHIEKTIQRACKTKRRAAPRGTGRCAPRC